MSGSVDPPPVSVHHAGVTPPRIGLRMLLQGVGFTICMGLLWWCARAVFKPENREQLHRLTEAPVSSVALLGLLALASLLINGAVFQAALWPVKRLGTVDIQATNAVGTLLALLPFKLSVVFRIVVHNRRDKVPLLTIIAWFFAVATVAGAAVLSPLIASLWRGRVDALWWAVSLGGIAVHTAIIIAIAAALKDGRGWALFERIVRGLPLPAAIKGSTEAGRERDGVLPRIHEAFRMLAHPRAVIVCVLLRMLEVAVNTGRFLIAASILGVTLPTEKALIAAASYFIIGVAAPTGQLGAREAGTAAILGRLMQDVNLEQFQLIALLVTAADGLVVLIAAGLGALWLRPWRLKRPAPPAA